MQHSVAFRIKQAKTVPASEEPYNSCSCNSKHRAASAIHPGRDENRQSGDAVTTGKCGTNERFSPASSLSDCRESMNWQVESESRAAPRKAGKRDAPSMALDYLSDNRQAETGANDT